MFFENCAGWRSLQLVFTNFLDLKWTPAQENSVKGDKPNQYDKHRHHEGDGPLMSSLVHSNFLQKIPMLVSSSRQCQSAQGNETQSQVSRRVGALDFAGGNFFGQVLEEFVNTEAEADHRKSGPDPCH